MSNILAEAFLQEQVKRISRRFAMPGEEDALGNAIVTLMRETYTRVLRMQERWNRETERQKRIAEHVRQRVQYCTSQGENDIAEALQSVLNAMNQK